MKYNRTEFLFLEESKEFHIFNLIIDRVTRI